MHPRLYKTRREKHKTSNNEPIPDAIDLYVGAPDIVESIRRRMVLQCSCIDKEDIDARGGVEREPPGEREAKRSRGLHVGMDVLGFMHGKQKIPYTYHQDLSMKMQSTREDLDYSLSKMQKSR
jgi:hypothetical protein